MKMPHLMEQKGGGNGRGAQCFINQAATIGYSNGLGEGEAFDT